MAIKYKPSKEINVLGRKNLLEYYELSNNTIKQNLKQSYWKSTIKQPVYDSNP